MASKIFSPFKALGFVSNQVPLVIRYNEKRKETLILTCVGRNFHTYNFEHLGIVNVSELHPMDIQCLLTTKSLVFTSYGNIIKAFGRTRNAIKTFICDGSTIIFLLNFGNHLISVDDNQFITVWDIETTEKHASFQINLVEITAVLHPALYNNEVLFACKSGKFELWDLYKCSLIKTFDGWGKKVTALQQSTVENIISIGLEDGCIFLFNISTNEIVFKFKQDWGPVTCITFRTDGYPHMATASNIGHIAIWNLNDNKIQSQIIRAHNKNVYGMHYLQNEPILITNSDDNSLKIWIFDEADGGARLLRYRSGHGSPPNFVKFHDDTNILSAADDSNMMSFSIRHDSENKSLGRASYNKKKSVKNGLKFDNLKMSPIVTFANEICRESDWSSIVAIHRNERVVTSWNYIKSTMGNHKFLHDRFKENEVKFRELHATAVDISSCGNFTIIGYSSGHIDIYNLQSGLHRGILADKQLHNKELAHNGYVRSVSIDKINERVITTGFDCKLKFWNFKSQKLLFSEILQSPPSQALLHRESSLLAVCQDNFEIVIVDILTQKIVRCFIGHSSFITDIAFSNDSRWLISASVDKSIRVWDMVTGFLIDCFIVTSPVRSLALSPKNDFLVTIHSDSFGIFLWSNKTLFSHVSIQPLPTDFCPPIVENPTVIENLEKETVYETEDIYSYYKSPEQLDSSIITYSGLPASKWENLLLLDVIKARNKPKEPTNKPKNAPFFLPTIPGLEPTFSTPQDEKNQIKTNIKKDQFLSKTDFGCLLEQNKFKNAIEYLKKIGPSSIETEILSLASTNTGSNKILIKFLEMINYGLSGFNDFELHCYYFCLFFKLHVIEISQDLQLSEAFNAIKINFNSDVINNFCKHLNESICITEYLKSALF